MSEILDHADRLRAVVDIGALVGRYVELRRAGVNMKGLCPFHREKSPSFTVHPGKGIFHCFGCGKGGDAIKFLMEIEHLEWIEAVKLLSEQHGMELPERPRGGDGHQAGDRDREREERDRLKEITRMAAEGFQRRLAAAMGDPATEAATYMAKRGLGPADAARFGLGLAPDGWTETLETLRAAKFPDDAAVTAGLAIRNVEKNRLYDRFRRRLMFPIHDNLGRPIAFGGRVFASDAAPDEPKYVNSPETPLYRKGQLLYALHLAKDAIARSRRALVMEGYMDVIRAHLAGFTEAVATCGTALTEEQARQLRRLADEVVFVYDGDEAGQKAMRRGTEILLEQGFEVRVLDLPAGDDPDSFLRTKGPEAFGRLVTGARPFLEVFLRESARRHGTRTADGKARVGDDVLPLVRRVKNPIAAADHARQVAEFLDVDVSVIQRTLAAGNKPASGAAARPGPGSGGSGGSGGGGPEIVAIAGGASAPVAVALSGPVVLPPLRDLQTLRLLFESAAARAALLGLLAPEGFEDPRAGWWLDRLRLLVVESPECFDCPDPLYDRLTPLCEHDSDHALLRVVSMDAEPIDETDRTLKHVVARMQRAAIRRGAERMRREMQRSGPRHDDEDDGMGPHDSSGGAAGFQPTDHTRGIYDLSRPLPALGRDYFLRPGGGSG